MMKNLNFLAVTLGLCFCLVSSNTNNLLAQNNSNINQNDQAARKQMGIAEDEKILGIPVSAEMDFEVDQLVDFVRYRGDSVEKVVSNARVFLIGEPQPPVKDENGNPKVMRYISIVVKKDDVKKIVDGVEARDGSYVLQPANRPANTVRNSNPAGTQTNNTNRPIPNRQLAGNMANQAPAANSNGAYQPQMSNAELSTNLRTMARMFEEMAANLEVEDRYEQADLIREAVQKLREAARIK